nr:hypothetical protein [Angustibacter aerolatus]
MLLRRLLPEPWLHVAESDVDLPGEPAPRRGRARGPGDRAPAPRVRHRAGAGPAGAALPRRRPCTAAAR